jgi:hypothetical protein
MTVSFMASVALTEFKVRVILEFELYFSAISGNRGSIVFILKYWSAYFDKFLALSS